MKLKKSLIFPIVAILTSLVLFSDYIYVRYHQTHFICDGKVNIIDAGKKYEMQILMRYDGDIGFSQWRSKNAKSSDENQPTEHTQYFLAQVDGNKFTVKSLAFTKDWFKDVDPDLLLPDYFFHPGRELSLNVYPRGNIRLFTFNGIPTYICRNTTDTW